MPREQRSVKKLNGEVLRERDLRLWWHCFYGIFVGIAVVIGFACVIQQHFTAHQFSVKNVELQRERERLKNEQKRLLLERETVVSLDQLKQRAERIGLREPTAAQINAALVASPNNPATDNQKPPLRQPAEPPNRFQRLRKRKNRFDNHGIAKDVVNITLNRWLKLLKAN